MKLVDPTPPTYFAKYLNLAPIQNSIGVNLNYTESNNDVYYAFQKTGDFVYPNFIQDLEMILNNSVRVAMMYGDADYICNWFGGEAVSMEIDYIHSGAFRAAPYAPFTVDGIEYGEVRQYGNFSFTRIYEAGHEVPFYQPVAALEMFRRVLGNVDIASGEVPVTGTYETNGTLPSATHTEAYVAIPSGNATAMSYTAAITVPITSVPADGMAAKAVATSGPKGRFVERKLVEIV